MLSILHCLLPIITLIVIPAMGVVATDTEILMESEWMPRKLSPTAINTGYNAISSDRQEIRWCKDLDGPTRTLSLTYSYLVQTIGDVRTKEIETSLITAVANRALKCANPVVASTQAEIKVVALETSNRRTISGNYCKSEIQCRVIKTTWNIALEGDTNANANENRQIDSLALTNMLSIVEAAIEEVSFDNLSVSFISDMPALVSKVQGLAILTSRKEVKRGPSVFTVAFITISVAGTLIMFTLLLHRTATNNECDSKTDELDVPTSITVLKSSSDNEDTPSERAQDISPCNLDAKRFIFETEEDLHLMRMGNRFSYRGFCLELDTVDEDTDIEQVSF